jgi:hypothetical protein
MPNKKPPRLDIDEMIRGIVEASVAPPPEPGKMFIDMVEHLTDCGLNWLMPDALEAIREKYLAGDCEAALADAMGAIKRLVGHTCVMTVGTSAAKPKIITGLKVKLAAKAGHEAVHGTIEEKSKRRQKYVKAFLGNWKPGDKRKLAYAKVARDLKVSAKTIERAVLAAGK